MNKLFGLSYKNELFRKAIHLLSIIFPIFYLFNTKTKTLYFLIIIFIFILIIEFFRNKKSSISLLFNKYLSNVVRKYEKTALMSATYLVISALLTIIIFDKNIAILALLIASICDTSAAVFGMKFGRIYFYNNKSLEGTFAFIFSGLGVVCIYNIYTQYDLYIIGIIAVIISSITEHITPTKFDNLTIPLSAALSITLFKLL